MLRFSVFLVAIAVIVMVQPGQSQPSDLLEQEIIISIFEVAGGYAGGYFIDGQMVASFTYQKDINYVSYHGVLEPEEFRLLLQRSMEELPAGLRLADITSIEGVSLSNTIGQPANAGKPWLESNGFYAADSWLTSDKFAHMLGTFVLSVKLRGVDILSGGNKYIAALEAVILGAVWEYKDYRYSWEVHGILGGDGFSYRDLVADIIGAAYSLHLLDPLFDPATTIVKKYDEAVVARLLSLVIKDAVPQELEEPRGILWVEPSRFWGRLIRVVIYDGTVIVVSATYNMIVSRQWFPDGTNWVNDDDQQFGVSYNAEISWILGPFGQSLVEDCASDEVGFVVGEVFIAGNEAQNAVFSSTNVPFLGGKEKGGGWNRVHLLQGSTVNVAWYGLRKVNRLIFGRDAFQYGSTGIGVTPGGLGVSVTNHYGQVWLVPYQTGAVGGVAFGFSGDFTGVVRRLFR